MTRFLRAPNRWCLAFAIVISLLLVTLFVIDGNASEAIPPQVRVLVKLRPALAQEMEAALPMGTMSLAPQLAGDPRVRSCMTRHSARKLAPLYPELVRAKKSRGLTDRQVALAIRQRFAARAARLHTAFEPPEISRTYVLELDGSAKVNLRAALDRLKADPDVEFAEEDKVVSVVLTPNDPYFNTYGSWGQPYADLWGIQKIGAPSAWDNNAGDGIVVAVVDTGIDYNHPDIAANVWSGNRGQTGQFLIF